MNKLIVLLCLSVMVWFVSTELFNGHKDDYSNQTQVTNVQLQAIPTLNVSELEQSWQQALDEQLRKQALAEQAKAQPEAKQNKNLISIGNQSFELIGVFKQKTESFVLLKPETGALIKSAAGQVVVDDIKVAKISANSVVLSNSEQSKEFKLFKWQNNE